MTEDRFEHLMRDAAQTFRRPPEAPPLDEMWGAIEAELGTRHSALGTTATSIAESRVPRAERRVARYAAIAATLVIGIALGRASTSLQKSVAERRAPSAERPVATAEHQATHADSMMSEPYQVATTRYLGQTAALLIALPTEVKAGRADDQFIARAGDLLSTTRLLLDSPASHDAQMRNLLEDLELVLAQVVRLQQNDGPTKMDMINKTLEARGVLPRLRTAVTDISADD